MAGNRWVDSVRMARANLRDGYPLNDREQRALDDLNAYHDRIKKFHVEHPGWPFQKRMRKFIDDVASLEVHDGATTRQIAQALGKSVSLVRLVRVRYQVYYQERLEAELLTRRQLLDRKIEDAQARSLRRRADMMDDADRNLGEILAHPLTEKIAFAKLAAVKEVRETVGADITSIKQSELQQEFSQVMRDLVGVVKAQRAKDAPPLPAETEIAAEDAEIVEDDAPTREG